MGEWGGGGGVKKMTGTEVFSNHLILEAQERGPSHSPWGSQSCQHSALTSNSKTCVEKKQKNKNSTMEAVQSVVLSQHGPDKLPS